MFNFNIKSLALILSLLIIISLGGWVIYAWTGPTSAPPGSNAPQPLNIGTTDQDKAARISATEFYDADNSSFYINPSGDSSISGVLTVGGDISDGAKTIYDSSSGRLDYSVLPYHKGDLTSDWASNSYTSGYYDVVDLTADNVRGSVNYGRGNSGTLTSDEFCLPGSASVEDLRSGTTADIDCDGVVEDGTLQIEDNIEYHQADKDNTTGDRICNCNCSTGFNMLYCGQSGQQTDYYYAFQLAATSFGPFSGSCYTSMPTYYPLYYCACMSVCGK